MYVYSLMDEDHFDIKNKYETQEDAFNAGVDALRDGVANGKIKVDEDELYFVYTGKIIYPDINEILENSNFGFDVISKITECIESWIEDDYDDECIRVGDYIPWIKKIRRIDRIDELIKNAVLARIENNILDKLENEFCLITEILENEIDDDEIDAYVYDLVYKTLGNKRVVLRFKNITLAKEAANKIHDNGCVSDFFVLQYRIRDNSLNRIYEQDELLIKEDS